jgi:hypothetical protein
MHDVCALMWAFASMHRSGLLPPPLQPQRGSPFRDDVPWLQHLQLRGAAANGGAPAGAAAAPAAQPPLELMLQALAARALGREQAGQAGRPAHWGRGWGHEREVPSVAALEAGHLSQIAWACGALSFHHKALLMAVGRSAAGQIAFAAEALDGGAGRRAAAADAGWLDRLQPGSREGYGHGQGDWGGHPRQLQAYEALNLLWGCSVGG